MKMKLYSSLSNKVEEFRPIHAGRVGLYTCGPTVYDHVHIGNLRTYITEDILRRTLKIQGYKVKHVMNITNIEDKIFARAKETGKSYKEITNNFEKIFFEDAAKIGIDLSDSIIIKATDAIEDMQQLIRKIPNRYIADDGIYFDIAKYPNYGVLVKLDRTHAHHRINNDEYDKEHVADFALWKTSKDNEPAWDFEINGKNVPGRPGWHIECSAMSTKYLGQPFDIHTGGVDLKFPHHENEIAQSKAASGKDLARLWLHAEHLLVNGKKMSKSLKNFYTLEDIKKKGYDPLAFRLLMLQAHYRSQLNFTWESLGASQNRLRDLQAWADLRHQPSTETMPSDLDDLWRITLKGMLEALANDLDTPTALSVLSKLVNYMANSPIPKKNGKYSDGALKLIDSLLGLGLDNRSDISDEQKQLIEVRENARKAKDWNKADESRKKLEEQKIGIRDTDHGPIWYRL